MVKLENVLTKDTRVCKSAHWMGATGCFEWQMMVLAVKRLIHYSHNSIPNLLWMLSFMFPVVFCIKVKGVAEGDVHFAACENTTL